MSALDIADCINEPCPWSGKPLQADSMAEHGGLVVGFCNTGCRDKKEMRFAASDGEWRLAFDPARNAVLLVAGDKSGGSSRWFYRTLIRKADERFDRHLARLAKEGGSRWV